MTYIGPTLLGINPYALVDKHFFTETYRDLQRRAFDPKFTIADAMPHNWSMACNVFVSLFNSAKGSGDYKKQAMCIAGESGAGKTVNTV
jgi:myosin heavy subunit